MTEPAMPSDSAPAPDAAAMTAAAIEAELRGGGLLERMRRAAAGRAPSGEPRPTPLRLDSRTVRSCAFGLALASVLLGYDLNQTIDLTDLVAQIESSEGFRLVSDAAIAVAALLGWVYRVRRRAP